MDLTNENVEAVFKDCLNENDDHIMVRGITMNAGLSDVRVARHRADIDAMLDQLPEEFHEGAGGGWSFLNACNDRMGRQWTGEHRIHGAAVPPGDGARPRRVPAAPGDVGVAPRRDALLRDQ